MTKLIGINIGEGAKPEKKALFPKAINPVLRNVANSNFLKHSTQKSAPYSVAWGNPAAHSEEGRRRLPEHCPMRKRTKVFLHGHARRQVRPSKRNRRQM